MTTTLEKLSGIEQKVYFLFEERDQRVVRLEEVAQALGISRRYASKVLHALTRKNAFEKVKSGLYIRFPASIVINKGAYHEDPILVAGSLQGEYFLSYYTALYFHAVSQRTTKIFYISNMEKSGQIKYHDNTIRLVRLTPQRFFGVTSREYSGQELSVSDLERTMLDVIDRPAYSGGWPEVIQCLRNARNVDWDKLLKYLLRFKTKSLIQKSGYIFEMLKNEIKTPKVFLNNIRKEVSPNIYYFNKGRGRLNRRWNVIVDDMIFKG